MQVGELPQIMRQESVRKLFEIISENGGESRFVGGCVRDMLMGIEIDDIDICTTLLPQKIINIFTQKGIKVIPTGLEHGTVMVVIDKDNFEITTLRRDIRCTGRHAEIEYINDWKEDAARRDFTFNALSCDLQGNVYDYFDGIKDLENRNLRFVNNIETRIVEDYLRILRAFRFAHKVCNGSEIDTSILLYIKYYSEKLKLISIERIRDEFIKILTYNGDLSYVLLKMYECGILKAVGLEYIKLGCIDYKKIDEIDSDGILKLSIILKSSEHDSNVVYEFVKYWKFSKKNIKRIMNISKIQFTNIDDNTLYKLIRKHGKDMMIDSLWWLYYKCFVSHQELQKKINIINDWNVPALPINGKDLMVYGIRPGKELGDVLSKLEHYWEKYNYSPNKEELLRVLSNYLTDNTIIK